MKKNDKKPKKDKGIIITKIGGQWLIKPNKSFEELKQEGLESWEKEKKDLIKQYKFMEIEITEQDIKSQRLKCFGCELEKIKIWLSDTRPNGKKRHFTSELNKIEIKKYQDYVKAKILALKKSEKLTSKGLSGLSPRYFGILLNIIKKMPTRDNYLELCKKFGINSNLRRIISGYHEFYDKIDRTGASVYQKDWPKFNAYDLIINILADRLPEKPEFKQQAIKEKDELKENMINNK